MADIKSTTGSLSFDVDADGQAEMQLSTSGLGLGGSASANLHILGNAVISNQLSIGTMNGSDNLVIHGTIGYGFQQVSTSVSLGSMTHVLADASNGNITLTFPYAANVQGRSYHIKKINSENSVWIEGGGNLIDRYSAIQLQNLSSVKVISNGQQWFILDSEECEAYSVASENLMAWWTFDESSGNTATDATGRRLDGSLEAGVSFTNNSSTGQIDGSLDLDGSDDYVDFGSEAGDLIEGTAFSVSCWFKINGATSNLDGIISKDSTGPFAYTVRYSGTVLAFMMNGNNLVSTFTPTQGIWYHLVTNFDTVNGRNMYINGSSIASDAYVTQAASNNDALYVGFDHNVANTRHPPMSIDDLRIFNRALSESEIDLIYASGQ